RHDLHVDLLHAIADRADDVQARAFHLGQHAPEAVNDALLVLLDHFQTAPGSGQSSNHEEHDDDYECCDHMDHLSPTPRLMRITCAGAKGVGRNNHRAEIASQ